MVGQSLGHVCSAKTHLTPRSTCNNHVRAGPCPPWDSGCSSALGLNRAVNPDPLGTASKTQEEQDGLRLGCCFLTAPSATPAGSDLDARPSVGDTHPRVMP